MFLNIQDFNLVLMSNCTGRLNDAAGFNSRLIKLVEFFFSKNTCNFVLEHIYHLQVIRRNKEEVLNPAVLLDLCNLYFSSVYFNQVLMSKFMLHFEINSNKLTSHW